MSAHVPALAQWFWARYPQSYEIVRGRLVREPLTEVSLVGADRGSGLPRCHRTLCVQCLVSPRALPILSVECLRHLTLRT